MQKLQIFAVGEQRQVSADDVCNAVCIYLEYFLTLGHIQQGKLLPFLKQLRGSLSEEQKSVLPEGSC